MIFLETYKELVSDYIKENYDLDKESENLMMYKKISQEIKNEHDLNKPIHLTFNEYVEEILADLDLVETSINNPSTVANLTKLIISFSFRYLKDNFYFDKSNRWLWERLYKTYRDKNNDYNNSAEKQFKIDGIKSYKIRIQDKISRLYSFTLNRNMSVNEEKKEDTIRDLIGYCMIFLIWYEKDMPRYK